MKRDDFPEGVKRALRERVGGRCSRPDCGRVTVSPNIGEAGRADITGRAAHITAAREGGPRFDRSLTPEKRASADNGIWLCADCADLVDKNSGKDFTTDQLSSWKRVAEEKQHANARLRLQLRRPAWLDQMKTPHYVNVPRLVSIAGAGAFTRETLKALEHGFSRGRFMLVELNEVEHVLRRAGLEAVDIREVRDPANQLLEGLTLSFHQGVYAKNAHSENLRYVRSYSFDNSPQIYLSARQYRYVFPFDPAWLTTNTAQNLQGRTTLAGVGVVKTVDHLAKQVIATPLAFGIPSMFEF